jgi:chaperonin GroES
MVDERVSSSSLESLFLKKKQETRMAEVGITPIGNRVLVERVAAESMSAGGILIPQTAQEKNPPVEGYVIAAGDGRTSENGTLIPTKVAVGDRVVFGSFVGVEVNVEGKKYLMMTDEEILGVLREDKAEKKASDDTSAAATA